MERDADGNWTGEWTTMDEQACDFTDDNMGFEHLGFAIDLDFSEMEIEDEDDTRVLLRAEDASVATMGTVFGGPGTTQQQAEAGSVGERAAPSGGGTVAR